MTSLRSTLAGLAVLAVLAPACASSTTERESLPPLATVEHVDLSRYLGTWYEIASYPQRFQAGCTATTATYSLRDDGTIDVLNRCRKGGLDGKLDEAKGRARVVDEATQAKLEVSFFGPFWGDYWIIDLDKDYGYVAIGEPKREYFWILARKPVLDDAVYQDIVRRAEAMGFSPAKIERSPQNAEVLKGSVLIK